MLSLSIDTEGHAVSLDGLTDPGCTKIDGIPHSETLLRFSDAFMGDDENSLVEARNQFVEEFGVEAMVDAVGIASSFQSMNRIADATGIPTEEPIAIMQEDLVKQLDIDKYVSAANTKPLSWIKRLFYKLVVIPQIRKAMKKSSIDKT